MMRESKTRYMVCTYRLEDIGYKQTIDNIDGFITLVAS